MTRSKDPAQAVEKAKWVIPLGLEPRFVPSGATIEHFKQWFSVVEPDFIFSVVNPGDAGSGKSSLAKLLHEGAFAEWQARRTNEPLSRVFSKIRPALPTSERVGEEALRARVSELEQKLAEAENINRVQRSRLSEERRAAGDCQPDK